MQGVGSAESGGVLRYCEHFGLCRATQQWNCEIQSADARVKCIRAVGLER